MEYYVSLMEEENTTIYNNMDKLEDVMQREISQSQKDKYYMIPLIWNI